MPGKGCFLDRIGWAGAGIGVKPVLCDGCHKLSAGGRGADNVAAAIVQAGVPQVV